MHHVTCGGRRTGLSTGDVFIRVHPEHSRPQARQLVRLRTSPSSVLFRRLGASFQERRRAATRCQPMSRRCAERDRPRRECGRRRGRRRRMGRGSRPRFRGRPAGRRCLPRGALAGAGRCWPVDCSLSRACFVNGPWRLCGQVEQLEPPEAGNALPVSVMASNRTIVWSRSATIVIQEIN